MLSGRSIYVLKPLHLVRLRLVIAAVERSRGQRWLVCHILGRLTLKIQHIVVGTFPRHCYSRFTFYEPMCFSGRQSRKICRKGRMACKGVGAKAKQPGPGVHDELSRHRRSLKDKSFSLTIRADDDRRLLETRVEYMHQAFQRLVDWSIGETGYDVSAVISGPNGFYTNHRITASGDFAWIESDRT